MKVLLDAKVTKVGETAGLFLQEKMMIIFNDDVPEELHDIAVLHTKSVLAEAVQVGDYFVVGGRSFRVTSVGDKANETLESIGHCTIKFDGGTEPDLPGTIHVECREIEPVNVNTAISFVRV